MNEIKILFKDYVFYTYEDWPFGWYAEDRANMSTAQWKKYFIKAGFSKHG